MSEAEAEEKAKKRIAFLSREIKANDSLYYQDDNPVLSDADYDALRKEPVSYTHLTLPTIYSV